MDIERDKLVKMVIVAIATLAALAVTNILVQLIQTILPFVIVAAGVYAGYRWIETDSAAPTADEVEEQARGLFSRFRRTKKAVETTMKVSEVINDLTGKSDEKKEEKKADVVEGKAHRKRAKAEPVVQAVEEEEQVVEEVDQQEEVAAKIKQSLESNPEGDIEFKDRDVVISKDDFIQPDISRLEEKEKEVPTVNDNVLSQIEERRRRLQQGRD